jgi:hypothetical protein
MSEIRGCPLLASSVLGFTLCLFPSSASAQSDGGPVPPAVVAQDESGRIALRAVRLERPLEIDGHLDEPVYAATPAIDRFVQQVPQEGAPATENTQAWIFFDDENFYFSARCLDSQPERIVANELRHDSSNIFNGGDSMTLVLDTFFDQRNGVLFQTNPLGALREQAIADGVYIESWNTVWQVRSVRTEDGWSLEMAIPFKSLRYRDSGQQVWGINFRRVIRWKNEYSGVTPIPASFGPSGLAQMQVAATLHGLSTPARSRNLELKPYAVSSVTTDTTVISPFRNRRSGDLGGDLKYGLSRSLTADVTINTDFAQIEEDVQQINLTRFNLLFPEKRDFFLEGQGIYAFGGRSLSGRGSGDTDDVPIMFFSRQIGLQNGQTIPVIGGGRVTGKAGRYDIAALNIQTAEQESARALATNFTAVRVRRDILRRSNIGVMTTLRQPSGAGNSSALFGADASIRISPNTTVLGYYARTDRPTLEGPPSSASASRGTSASYRARFDYAGDRYGLVAEHLLVDDGFAPAVGYTRRENFRRNLAAARFSPRLRRHRYMRRLSWEAGYTYDTSASEAQVENRSLDGRFGIEFHSGDQASVQYVDEYELLPQNFRIATGVTIPQGGYKNRLVTASYTMANQRPIAGRMSVVTGKLYDGHRDEISYSGRIAPIPQFAVEPGISLAWVDLPYGDFSARLVTGRFSFTPTTRLLVSSLLQFNADARTLSSSVRLRWEYLPGSELFVVYSDGRDTSSRASDVLNRSVAVKATRLLRF